MCVYGGSAVPQGGDGGGGMGDRHLATVPQGVAGDRVPWGGEGQGGGGGVAGLTGCAPQCVCMAVLRSPGGGGDRHLVTVPQGVAGGRLPWGGEGQGGARVPPCGGLDPRARVRLEGGGLMTVLDTFWGLSALQVVHHWSSVQRVGVIGGLIAVFCADFGP